MKKEQLYEALGDIDEKYIAEARHETKKKVTPLWLRWGAMVACLCLAVITAAVVFLGNPVFGPEEDKTDDYGNTVSYAGWSDDPALYEGAVNKELLQDGTDVHLPVFQMDTLADLEQFRTNYGGVFSMGATYNDALSFDGALAKAQWDREMIFEDHSLLVIYVPSTSGSYRYGVQKVTADGASLCVSVEQKNDPEAVTCDLAGWFILMEIRDEEIRTYSSIDALLEEKK